MNLRNIQDAFRSAYSKSDVCRALGLPINGTGMRKVSSLAEEYGLSMDHFDPNRRSRTNRIYPLVIKECPVCQKPFESSIGAPREKMTCSHACSNTHFRSGTDNPNWSGDNYRSVCFLYHKKECIVCKENLIVAVHHYDEDNSNHSPENLMPLCPTHHTYVHSQYAHLVSDQLEEYRNAFIASLKDS